MKRYAHFIHYAKLGNILLGQNFADVQREQTEFWLRYRFGFAFNLNNQFQMASFCQIDKRAAITNVRHTHTHKSQAKMIRKCIRFVLLMY